MAQETKMIYNLFQISIDPMERLLLVNFEKDPDTLYVGFEPQVFDDDVNGRGHLIIGWRSYGRVVSFDWQREFISGRFYRIKIVAVDESMRGKGAFRRRVSL